MPFVGARSHKSEQDSQMENFLRQVAAADALKRAS
jgi:hypothetical protein